MITRTHSMWIWTRTRELGVYDESSATCWAMVPPLPPQQLYHTCNNMWPSKSQEMQGNSSPLRYNVNLIFYHTIQIYINNGDNDSLNDFSEVLLDSAVNYQ